jgi:hypothetical protein
MATSAMNKLPDFKGTIYRGIPFRTEAELNAFLDRYTPGNAVSEPAFTHSGKAHDVGVAWSGSNHTAGRVVLHLDAQHGKDLSFVRGRHLGVDEVMHPPHTTFYPTEKWQDSEGRWHLKVRDYRDLADMPVGDGPSHPQRDTHPGQPEAPDTRSYQQPSQYDGQQPYPPHQPEGSYPSHQQPGHPPYQQQVHNPGERPPEYNPGQQPPDYQPPWHEAGQSQPPRQPEAPQQYGGQSSAQPQYGTQPSQGQPHEYPHQQPQQGGPPHQYGGQPPQHTYGGQPAQPQYGGQPPQPTYGGQPAQTQYGGPTTAGSVPGADGQGWRPGDSGFGVSDKAGFDPAFHHKALGDEFAPGVHDPDGKFVSKERAIADRLEQEGWRVDARREDHTIEHMKNPESMVRRDPADEGRITEFKTLEPTPNGKPVNAAKRNINDASDQVPPDGEVVIDASKVGLTEEDAGRAWRKALGQPGKTVAAQVHIILEGGRIVTFEKES